MWTFVFLISATMAWPASSQVTGASLAVYQPVGVQDNTIIPNDYMTASSQLIGSEAYKGRLNGDGAWQPSGQGTSQFLAVDLGKMYYIFGIQTQGQGDGYIETFRIIYQEENSTELTLYAEDSVAKIFTGNSDNETIVQQNFTKYIHARYILVNPQTFSGAPRLRIELLGVEDIDECASFPCAHGTCTDGVVSYTCSCENGWSGTNCDQDIDDDCLSSPCAYGTCTDGVASYTCSCENGWTGTNCDQNLDDCASSPCVHGACTDGVASYTCSCENGWTGTNCDQDIDDCASTPCAHGTCTDGVASYTCSCENGWTGTNCDQDIDECASNPCWLGGTCLDHVNGYSCVCPKDTTGKHCETVPFAGVCYQFSATTLTHREATLACSTNGGRMVNVKDEQQQLFLADKIAATTAASNWLAMKAAPLAFLYGDGSAISGSLQWSANTPADPCDLCVLMDSSDSYLANIAPCAEQHNYICQSTLKPCDANVCQNGGNCTSCFNGSATFCDCPGGFEGKACELNIDECASNPCQNGGTCQDAINSYSCHCKTGFLGDHCEFEMDWCSQAQCPSGWTCQDFNFYFLCLHPAPITRQFPYQCSSASCPDGMYCTEEGVASFSCKAV